MALIKTVAPDQAEGKIKKAYDRFIQSLGMIPKPMEMMSASPAIFEQQLEKIRYYSNHPTLSFALLTHIRYLVAHHLGYPFCTGFNKLVLKRQGLEDDDIRQAEADPSRSMLEEKEAAMLDFVVNAVKAPGFVQAEEIEKLKAMGWEDRDLVDALAHGVNMIDHAIMMEAFQIDQETK